MKPSGASQLTLAELERVRAQLRRASHSGEMHRIDRLNEQHGMVFAMGRWKSNDSEMLRWLMSMHRIDFGYCNDAPDLLPAGGMVCGQIDVAWYVPMPSTVSREQV